VSVAGFGTDCVECSAVRGLSLSDTSSASLLSGSHGCAHLPPTDEQRGRYAYCGDGCRR
jgi:hypothetical protein